MKKKDQWPAIPLIPSPVLEHQWHEGAPRRGTLLAYAASNE
jgi:hypothetical protein